MVPKGELTFVLPSLSKFSLDLRTRLRRTVERDLPYCKLKLIFRTKCRLNTLFRFKDSIEKRICSGIIYRYTSSNCKVTYYGKTSATIIPELLITWGFRLLQGYVSKTLNSLQYLTIFCSVVAP